jgi:hypothetical protein
VAVDATATFGANGTATAAVNLVLTLVLTLVLVQTRGMRAGNSPRVVAVPTSVERVKVFIGNVHHGVAGWMYKKKKKYRTMVLVVVAAVVVVVVVVAGAVVVVVAGVVVVSLFYEGRRVCSSSISVDIVNADLVLAVLVRALPNRYETWIEYCSVLYGNRDE